MNKHSTGNMTMRCVNSDSDDIIYRACPLLDLKAFYESANYN